MAGASRSAATPNPVFIAALVASAAALAAVALVSASLATKQAAFAIVATFVLLVAWIASGNLRLFTLWCLMLSAPLGIKKALGLIHAHMGGASAITIDGCDPFIAVLLVFIIRDIRAGRSVARWGGVCSSLGAP